MSVCVHDYVIKLALFYFLLQLRATNIKSLHNSFELHSSIQILLLSCFNRHREYFLSNNWIVTYPINYWLLLLWHFADSWLRFNNGFIWQIFNCDTRWRKDFNIQSEYQAIFKLMNTQCEYLFHFLCFSCGSALNKWMKVPEKYFSVFQHSKIHES